MWKKFPVSTTHDFEEVFKLYSLPGSYIEFVERLPRPENAVEAFEDEEVDLRSGFESASANKIFDSTSTYNIGGVVDWALHTTPHETPAPSHGAEKQRRDSSHLQWRQRCGSCV